MFKLPKEETQSLVALHGWSAILLGFLLYAVVVTGTVAVLAEEIRHWSIGEVNPENPLTTDVDTALRQLAPQVKPEFLEDIGISSSPRGNLQLFLHQHRTNDSGQIEEYGVQFEVDTATGKVLQERLGTGSELFESEPLGALSRFFVAIHTELHLPSPWGLLLTGILGLAMLVAAVTGFVMHRHLIADMFVLRRDRSSLAKKRDVHTVAGTWGLPFAFVLAFTGSFFSFAGSFGIPAMAMVAFGGDQETMIRTLIGVPATESDTPADTVNINRIIADGYQRGGEHATFVSIAHYGRDDAKVTLFLPPEEKKLDSVVYEYNGASGEFVRQKPPIGIAPSLGSTAFSLMGPLHFGHFAGLLSKAVWVALGFSSCYVILTGFTLWTARRAKEPGWQLFERYGVIFGLGLPVAMLFSAVGYFAAMMTRANPTSWVAWSFSIAAILFLLSGLAIKQARQLRLLFLGLSIALCLGLPILRLLAGGPFWVAALQNENIAVVLIDLLLIVLAVFSWQQYRALAYGASNADPLVVSRTNSRRRSPRQTEQTA